MDTRTINGHIEDLHMNGGVVYVYRHVEDLHLNGGIVYIMDALMTCIRTVG